MTFNFGNAWMAFKHTLPFQTYCKLQYVLLFPSLLFTFTSLYKLSKFNKYRFSLPLFKPFDLESETNSHLNYMCTPNAYQEMKLALATPFFLINCIFYILSLINMSRMFEMILCMYMYC